MRRIGLPKDHMLVLNANRLKALLFEGYSDNNLNRASMSISNLTMVI